MGTPSSAESLPRVSTGVEALDEVMRGGIPKGSVVFVAGLPGTGKSVLCQQMLWANSWRLERVLYVSTLSEPMIKMLRYAQTFSYFKASALNKNVVYADLGSILTDQGTEAFADELNRLVEEHRPGLVVIDSFKALRDFETGELARRKFVSALATRLGAWDITTLLVGEYAAEEIREQPEFAVADGIIYLHGTEEGFRQKRWLRIMKMRGTDYFAGDHLFDISPEGITLFPRMRPQIIGEYSTPSGPRISSAIEGLDELLGGGLIDSTSTLIFGSSGSGKTLTALSFAMGKQRSQDGERKTLFVSLEESSDQVSRNCEAFGWALADRIDQGRLAILHVSPSELDIDRHAVLIKDRAMEMHADTVILDSITSMDATSDVVAKLANYLWAISDHFKRNGIALVMTAEASNAASQRISPYADTLIELRLEETSGETTRTIRVLKMRGSTHDRLTRELLFEAPRITVGDRFSA